MLVIETRARACQRGWPNEIRRSDWPSPNCRGDRGSIATSVQQWRFADSNPGTSDREPATTWSAFDAWLIFQTIVARMTRRGAPCVFGGMTAP